jgi:S1-C subfamily serine protease
MLIDEPEETTAVDESRPPWRRSRLLWMAALLVAALVVVALQFSDGGPSPLTQADVDRAVQSGIEKAREEDRSAPPDAAAAYRRIVPSLVTIVTTGAPAKSSSDAVGKSSLGAGVIINAQGAVLTALHVVEGGAKIQVRFADGTRANAKVENRQPENDIAVLTVDQLPEVTVPAVMGGGAQVGDAVFPVGNPLGLQGSLTAGVVSALDRSIRAEGGQTLKQLIQFDAAVNPGNSGGPLLDRNGQVIGIVTALANPSGQSYFVGIGFAVPIATAGGAAGGPSK